MKRFMTLSLFVGLFTSAAAPALAGDMNMDGMDMKKMDMSGMNMDKKNTGATYEAVGEVKKVDREGGSVTLAHGPVPGLGWPAMTMTFAVKDNALLEKLGVGKQVHFVFIKQEEKYVITSVQ